MMLTVERPADVRLSFDRAADIYDEVRPSYPGPMFDELFQMLPPRPEIVEVGPGTGQATKDLLCSWRIRPRGRDRCRYGRKVASQPSRRRAASQHW